MATASASATAATASTASARSGVYTYRAPWPVYALGWCAHSSADDERFRLALGSFVEGAAGNCVQVLDTVDESETGAVGPRGRPSARTSAKLDGRGGGGGGGGDSDGGGSARAGVSDALEAAGDARQWRLTARYELPHVYPPTRVLWEPVSFGGGGGGGGATAASSSAVAASELGDLLGTSSDCLRLWRVPPRSATSPEASPHLVCALCAPRNAAAHSDYCAPLSSFDWSEADPAVLGAASVDTTVTVWDVRTQQVRTQLIAHDSAVYDIEFEHSGANAFVSVGADGSLRLFDMRNLDQSTILYETRGAAALLRVSWNAQDPNYLLTQQIGSCSLTILDMRLPSVPVAELRWHAREANAAKWSPSSRSHLASGAGDAHVLLWDIADMSRRQQHAAPPPTSRPIADYCAPGAVDNVAWSAAVPEWLGIVADGGYMQLLKV